MQFCLQPRFGTFEGHNITKVLAFQAEMENVILAPWGNSNSSLQKNPAGGAENKWRWCQGSYNMKPLRGREGEESTCLDKLKIRAVRTSALSWEIALRAFQDSIFCLETEEQGCVDDFNFLMRNWESELTGPQPSNEKLKIWAVRTSTFSWETEDLGHADFYFIVIN